MFCQLTGGVKINFKLSSPVRVLNCVELEGSNSEKDKKCFKDVFVTEFRFSRKSTIIVPANSSVRKETIHYQTTVEAVLLLFLFLLSSN